MGTIRENYQMMFTTYPDLVNIQDAYRLVRNNTIPSIKVGREYKIPKRNIIAYLTNQI